MAKKAPAKKKAVKKSPAKKPVKKTAAKKAPAKRAVTKQDPRTALEAQLRGLEKSLHELRGELSHFQATVVSSSRNLLGAFSGFRDALSFQNNPGADGVRQAATRLVDGVNHYIQSLQTRVRSVRKAG
ncbi:MAG: hypothetical protein KIT79_10350 [Deltaproteobacteria bacterium]|nr:hypothetical protein [Deltaproteobacteria bacterium]